MTDRTLPAPLDIPDDDRCATCGLTAAFIFRDRGADTVTRWCRIHVPFLAPSLTSWLEQAYLALQTKEPAD